MIKCIKNQCLINYSPLQMIDKLFKTKSKNSKKTLPKDRNKKISTKPKYPENESIDILLNNGLNNKGTKLGLSIIHIEILKKCKTESSAKELRELLNRTNASKFKTKIINPLLENGFFELSLPNTPKSPYQKYRLTGKFVKNKLT